MRLAPVVLGCAAALVLSGCATGRITERSEHPAAIDGSSGGVGPMLVRDVVLAYPENETNLYPAGADGPMELVIVNEGDRPDTLVSVTTPAAREVIIQGNTEIPSGTTFTVIEGDEQQMYPVPRIEPVPLPRPQQRPGPAAPGVGSSVRLGFGELRIVLTDLTRPIHAGESVPVTFRFRNAGEVTVPVPMVHPGHGHE